MSLRNKILLRGANITESRYMDKLTELNALIDKAAKVAGSDRKLAALLGEPPQRISNWRHGHAIAQPEDWALMAHVAGLDPVAELARATVAKHESKRKGDLLLKALGKASRLTGAVAASAGALVLVISGLIIPTQTRATEAHGVGNTMCIMSNQMAIKI